MGDPNSNDQVGFLAGKADDVENFTGYVDDSSAATDVLSAAGIAPRAIQAAAQISPFGGTLADAFANGSEAVDGGSSVLGSFGTVIGPVGTGLTAAAGLGDSLQLANDISRDGADAYHDPKAYDHAAGAAVAGMQTVLPYMGPYGQMASLGITGATLATDGAGAASGWAFGDQAGFSASSAEGGLLRGTVGDQSLGEQVRQGVVGLAGDNPIGNGLGVAADVTTNILAAPTNVANTVVTGVANEAGAIGNGITHGDGAVGGALASLGSW